MLEHSMTEMSLGRPARARRGRRRAQRPLAVALVLVALVASPSASSATGTDRHPAPDAGCTPADAVLDDGLIVSRSFACSSGGTAEGAHSVAQVGEAPPVVEATYDNPSGHAGPGYGFDSPADVVATRQGFFVTGISWSGPGAMQMAMTTIAFDNHGRSVWIDRVEGNFGGLDAGAAIAASPDGSKVFVTGTVDFRTSSGYAGNIRTIAYDATSGDILWSKSFDGPSSGDYLDVARFITVTPDGQSVIVGGASMRDTLDECQPGGASCTPPSLIPAIVAYDAAEGHELWRATDTQSKIGSPVDFTLSRDGRLAYAVGVDSGGNVITAAYRTSDDGAGHQPGSLAWTVKDGRLLSATSPVAPKGLHLAVTDDTVLVAGGDTAGTFDGYVVAAYDASTGSKLFLTELPVPQGYVYGRPTALTTSLDGSYFIVTGYADANTNNQANHDYYTAAFDAGNGGLLWDAIYDGSEDYPFSVTTSADGRTLYVTGQSRAVPPLNSATTVYWGFDHQPATIRAGEGWRAATVSYDAQTGEQLFVARSGTVSEVGEVNPEHLDYGRKVVVSPDGKHLIVMKSSSRQAASSFSLYTAERRAGVAPPLAGNTLDYGALIYSLGGAFR